MSEEIKACNVCSQSGQLKMCSRCKNVYYCSRDHQIADWSAHKLKCNTKPSNNKGSSARERTDAAADFDDRILNIISFDSSNDNELQSLSEFAHRYLNKNGFCVLDGVLKPETCKSLMQEMLDLRHKKAFQVGQLAGGKTSGVDKEKVVNLAIRSDEMLWLNGTETDMYPNICNVVQSTMDVVVNGLNSFQDNTFFIEGRTKVC